jgi:threonine synthase
MRAGFEEATLRGQAPDNGLYFPVEIPRLPAAFLRRLSAISQEEIAFRVIHPYTGDSLPQDLLRQIIESTVSFEFPLRPIGGGIFALELFHGPTLAFKDVGARFMSRCLAYFVRNRSKKTLVLVATSGDTGGAVADGFAGIPGIDVVILFPSGKVSAVQELQLTTQGKNISALEVKGTFDDCQQLVKKAFADQELNARLFLSSANSINVARWLPQQFYYFFAGRQWPVTEQPPVLSVPSGNFGNLCAGMLANRSGLPVEHFIAACNSNDPVTRYLDQGIYAPRPAVATISNAMDVGDPSNFVRILELFANDRTALKNLLSSISISDPETREGIRELWMEHGYLADPHGAVGYLALKKWMLDHSRMRKGIFLETAHPVKFIDTVEPLIGQPIMKPPAVTKLYDRTRQALLIEPVYEEFRDWLYSRA